MYEFVPDEYRRERYEACYAPMIFPVNGRSLWQRTAYTDLQPPPIRRQPGRPKKKRTKDPSEMLRDDSQMKRARYGIKCSRCKTIGHNKLTCKLPPAPVENQATDNPSSNQPQPTHNATTVTTPTTTVTQPPAPTQNQTTTSTTTTNNVIQQPPAPTQNQSTTSTHTTCSQPPFTQTFSTQVCTNAQTSAKSKSQANKKQGGASKTNSVATTQTASKTPTATSKTKTTVTKTAATNVATRSKRGPNTTRQKLPFKRGQTSATQPPSK